MEVLLDRMSYNTCIELSSDDECEIIGITDKVSTTIGDPPKHSLNIKKLTRNSNIELTINLEDNPNEPSEGCYTKYSSELKKTTNSNSTNQNGFINERPHTSERKRYSNKTNEFGAVKKDEVIPDIVIIDDDSSSKVPKTPQTNGLKSFFTPHHLSESFRNSPKNEGKNISQTNKPRSKEILESDVVVIDDDDDDDEVEVVKAPKTPRTINKSNSQPSKAEAELFKERIVNELRNKIEAGLVSSKSNKHESVTNSKNVRTKNDVKPASEKNSLGKKVVHPERLEIPDFPERETRITRGFLSSLSNSSQNGQSSSKAKKNQPGTSAIVSQPMNDYSIENMFSGLVAICNKVFTDDKLETKLWNSFRQASENVRHSEDFINALKVALNTSEKSNIETLDEKLAISRDVREVIRLLKRHPVVVDKKVKKLTKILTVIRGRIKKLEETEVTSDEDGEENTYVLLDRYRTKAAKIYDKICELQGESPHAGRAVKQRFSFTGNSGYPKIEQALQKYYLKTRAFPDFFDVKKLVEKTVNNESIDIPPSKIHTIAQSIFLEFGNRLQRMRFFDEYSIMNEYLEDGKTKDPALDNEELHKALAQWDSSKKIREGENKILEEYTHKQLEQKCKEEKSEASDEGSDKDNDASDDEDHKPDNQKELHLSDTDEELINSDVKDKTVPSDEEDEEPPSKVKKL